MQRPASRPPVSVASMSRRSSEGWVGSAARLKGVEVGPYSFGCRRFRARSTWLPWIPPGAERMGILRRPR